MVVQRSSQGDSGQSDRFVHAKVYRLWSRSEEREYIFIGSVNLTRAAHGKARAGNVEAAVLIEHDYVDVPRFWLDVEDEERPESFRVERAVHGWQARGARLCCRFRIAGGSREAALALTVVWTAFTTAHEQSTGLPTEPDSYRP